MSILTITELPYLAMLVVFIIIWILIDTVLRTVFPRKGSKIGKVIRRVSLVFILFASIYWYFNIQPSADPFIKEGFEIGHVIGKGKEIDWCLKNSPHQFQFGLEHEALLKIEGFSLGCLKTANKSQQLCQELPKSYSDVSQTDYFGKNCGTYTICEVIYTSAKEFCATDI